MPLSESQVNYNAKELAELNRYLANRYFRKSDGAGHEKLNNMFATMANTFTFNGVFLSDAVLDSLEDFVVLILLRNYPKKEFKKRLDYWIRDEYPAVEKSAERKLRHILDAQEPGITNSLLKFGDVDPETWGDDLDIRMVLKGEITNPEDIVKSGKYILPPVLIMADMLSAEQEKTAPYTFLKKHLSCIVRNNPGAEITVMVPVNCGRSHYMLFQADLNKGKIENARLINSMSKKPSDEALNNVIQAVTRVDPKASVEKVARGVQTNGHSCMDFTIQAALQKKYASSADVPDAGLRAIYTATKAHDLREAVIDTVIQNHPEMMAQTEQVTDVVKQVFTSPIKPEDLQDVIYTAFTFPIEEHVTAISIEQTKALQIKFDSTMARILDDLYKKNACMSDEVLFDKARELTYRKMQRSFGIFADKSGPSTTPSEPKKTISPK